MKLYSIVRAIFYPNGNVVEVEKYGKQNFSVTVTDRHKALQYRSFCDTQQQANRLIKQGDIV